MIDMQNLRHIAHQADELDRKRPVPYGRRHIYVDYRERIYVRKPGEKPPFRSQEIDRDTLEPFGPILNTETGQ